MSNKHIDNEFHHHHSHAPVSHHEHGHHLLQVEHLSVGFSMYDDASLGADKRVSQAIRDLTISVHRGEIIAVIGASGSGKSLLADSILGLYEPNSLVTGTVWFDGRLQDAAGLAKLRGHGISLVPQSVTSLDPLMKVGAQVRGVAAGKGRARKEDAARRRALQESLFERYGLAPEVADKYPHELSGGMVRRVLLCCALMDEPDLIVADEPTPGLDLDLAVRALADLRAFADEGGGVLLITHDIELALRVADRVAIFNDGTIVEEAAACAFEHPENLRDPFSRALVAALPERGFAVEEVVDARS
jgi:peptide/nickel transport system ATP-binding protein